MAYCDDINDLNRWGYPWHWAINKFNDGKHGDHRASFMYDAKEIAQESRRLPLLFEAERTGKLPKVHVQCSCCAPEHQHIADNHLTCCLGVECRKCPMLLALDGADLTDAQRDQAKSWTRPAAQTAVAASGILQRPRADRRGLRPHARRVVARRQPGEADRSEAAAEGRNRDRGRVHRPLARHQGRGHER